MTDLEKKVLDVVNGALCFDDHITPEVVDDIPDRLQKSFKQQHLSNFRHGVSEFTGAHHISFLLDGQSFYITFELHAFYLGG